MEIFQFVSEQWILVSILMLCVYGLILNETSKGGKNISHHQLSTMVNKDEAVVLDVRPADEFKAGHIAGAINISHATIADKLSELDKYKDSTTIVVVDQIGQHAGGAGRRLREAGFTVLRLSGGISEWKNNSLPLVKS